MSETFFQLNMLVHELEDPKLVKRATDSVKGLVSLVRQAPRIGRFDDSRNRLHGGDGLVIVLDCDQVLVASEGIPKLKAWLITAMKMFDAVGIEERFGGRAKDDIRPFCYNQNECRWIRPVHESLNVGLLPVVPENLGYVDSTSAEGYRSRNLLATLEGDISDIRMHLEHNPGDEFMSKKLFLTERALLVARASEVFASNPGDLESFLQGRSIPGYEQSCSPDEVEP